MNENEKKWDTLIKRIIYNWEHAWINSKECEKYLNILREINDTSAEYKNIAAKMNAYLDEDDCGHIYIVSQDWLKNFENVKNIYTKAYNNCLKTLKSAKNENKNYNVYLAELTSSSSFDSDLNFLVNNISNVKDFNDIKRGMISYHHGISYTIERKGVNIDYESNGDVFTPKRNYPMKKSSILNLQNLLSKCIDSIIAKQKQTVSKYDSVKSPVERKHKITFDEFENNAKANYLKGKRSKPVRKHKTGLARLENSVRRMW